MFESCALFSFSDRKFSESKQCLRDLITTNCSSGSRTSSLEFALVFDDYNPFCWGSTDQEQGTPTITRIITNVLLIVELSEALS